MERTTIVTPAISLARQLWRYGEDDLWRSALNLSPQDMVEIGERAGALLGSDQADSLWPNGPKGDKVVLLAGIEHLEGSVRPGSPPTKTTRLGYASGAAGHRGRAL